MPRKLIWRKDEVRFLDQKPIKVEKMELVGGTHSLKGRITLAKGGQEKEELVFSFKKDGKFREVKKKVE